MRYGHNSSGRLQECLEANIEFEAMLGPIVQGQLIDKDGGVYLGCWLGVDQVRANNP